MTGRLITLPVRLSLRATAALARGAADVASRALSAVEDRRRAGHGGSGASSAPAYEAADVRAPSGPPPSVSEPAPAAPAPAAASTAPPASAATTEPATPPPFAPIEASPPDRPASEEPAHVSEEPELVAELAEPGAEEGAGAQLTVLEPWEGYAQMNVRDIVARLATADDTELAAIELYEGSHRQRRTVLAAVQRRLRT